MRQPASIASPIGHKGERKICSFLYQVFGKEAAESALNDNCTLTDQLGLNTYKYAQVIPDEM